MTRYLIAPGLFLLLLIVLAIGLKRDPGEVPSPLVGKPAPEFTLWQLTPSGKKFSPADMRGKVWLLNVWATWCVSCRAEHAALVNLAATGNVLVVGLNYKEVRGDGNLESKKMPAMEEDALVRQRATAWLAERGNPYLLTALDIDGRVGLNYGVYGVPETYVIDQSGVIRYKQIGPLTAPAINDTILPLVRKLEAGA